MICQNCEIEFEGPKTKLYCGPPCRRRAKEIRKAKRYAEQVYAAMSPEERQEHDRLQTFLAELPGFEFDKD